MNELSLVAPPSMRTLGIRGWPVGKLLVCGWHIEGLPTHFTVVVRAYMFVVSAQPLLR